MELIRYWRVVRRRAWLIVLCPLSAALVAGIVTTQLPTIYEAKVSLLVRPAQPLAVLPGVSPLTSDQILRTYARLMTERPLLEKVIKERSLQTDPEKLSRRITVTPVINTLILDVAVQDTEPARAKDTANTLVYDFIAHIKEIQKSESQNPTASSADNLVVESPAILPQEPVSPKPLLNIGIGLLAGLVIGMGLAFLLDYLDQSVRSDDSLRERIGLAPLGHIAFVSADTKKRGELVTLAGDSPVVEAYKSLRTNLLFSNLDKEIRTIVITSAAPDEGKSRTAANLAIVLAEQGYRVLLIDADFRRPSLHRLFGKERNFGLSNLMLGQEPDLVADEQVPNLVVLTSGPTPPNPSELLGSAQLNSLMSRFRQEFSYILIDTPPVNTVTDASVVAGSADAAILVVDANKATYPALQHAKQALERVNARLLGVVMNKIHPPSAGYYYSGYTYQYGSPNGTSESAGVVGMLARRLKRRRKPTQKP
jgi:capsular exopolysaccharide synthesis family protein